MSVTRAASFSARKAAAGRAASAIREPSKGTRKCLNMGSPGKESLIQKVDVQHDDDRRDQSGKECGYGFVDQVSHKVGPAGKHHQGDDREGETEAEHHLADYQGA